MKTEKMSPTTESSYSSTDSGYLIGKSEQVDIAPGLIHYLDKSYTTLRVLTFCLLKIQPTVHRYFSRLG